MVCGARRIKSEDPTVPVSIRQERSKVPIYFSTKIFPTWSRNISWNFIFPLSWASSRLWHGQGTISL
jgi:hypothetical protein